MADNAEIEVSACSTHVCPMHKHLSGVFCLHAALSTAEMRRESRTSEEQHALVTLTLLVRQKSVQIINKMTNAHNHFKSLVGRKEGREGK